METQAEHERKVARMYGADVEKRLELKARPYHNMGFWGREPRDMDDAGLHLLEEVAARAGVSAGDEVLDVGCGFGMSTVDIHERWRCRRVVGIDVCDELLAHARQLAAAERAEGADVEVRKMSALALDFPDGSFERVLAVDCACHFLPRDRFFEQACRVLRPGGTLGIADTVAGERPSGLVARTMVDKLMGFWCIPRENQYGADAYVSRVRAAGFREVDCADVTGQVFPKAAAFVLSGPFQARYRQIFGPVQTMIRMKVFELIRWAWKEGYVRYVVLSARK